VRQSPLARENLTITWKQCKIGGKLVLITNRKSYISFQLVLKSVTLNGVMVHTLHYFSFSPNSVAFGAHSVKVVDIPKLCATEM